MTILKKILAASVVMACVSSATYAQDVSATAQATATAEIVAGIAITKNTDFHFGRLASNAGGTAELSPAGVVTPGAGVRNMAGGPPATSASFTVTGEGSNIYTIVFPSTPIVLTGSVTGALEISTFTTSAGAGTLANGTQTFTAGATLTLPASPAAGTYTSADFPVTVSYN